MLISRSCRSFRRIGSHLRCSYASARGVSQTAEDSANDLDIKLDHRLPALPPMKPQREPFAKNLFVGIFDTDILAFPEVQTNDRQNKYMEWLKPVEDLTQIADNEPSKVRNDLLPVETIDRLMEYGVFSSPLTETWRGLGLSTTERARLMEVVAKDPTLGSFALNNAEPVELLLKYGTEEQKQNYLPRVFSGELRPTMCIIDGSKYTIGQSQNTVATLSLDGQFWTLNGSKTFVNDGNEANLLFVLAICTAENDPFHRAENTAIFMVDRSAGGISVSKVHEKLGQNGLKSCDLEFIDTVVPDANMLGKMGSAADVMVDLLTLGKYNVGAQATALLKDFIQKFTKYIIHKKYFDKNVSDFHFTQEIVAKITTSLYAIESMTYLTTGLIDRFEDQDCSLENAIVQLYASQECVAHIYEGLRLIGIPSYFTENHWEQIYRDALALTLYNGSTIDLNNYIAVMGLRHAGIQCHEVIQKYRNPFMFPAYVLKEVIFAKSVPDLALEEHLHPSLQMSAKLLEKCVHKLNQASQTLLVAYGNEVTEHHMELRRLSEMALNIYAMTAVLARCSRSYCIGLRHADKELQLCHSICWNAFNKVETNFKEIEAGSVENCDELYQKIARNVYKNGGYFPEHPLTKNY